MVYQQQFRLKNTKEYAQQVLSLAQLADVTYAIVGQGVEDKVPEKFGLLIHEAYDNITKNENNGENIKQSYENSKKSIPKIVNTLKTPGQTLKFGNK